MLKAPVVTDADLKAAREFCDYFNQWGQSKGRDPIPTEAIDKSIKGIAQWWASAMAPERTRAAQMEKALRDIAFDLCPDGLMEDDTITLAELKTVYRKVITALEKD